MPTDLKRLRLKILTYTLTSIFLLFLISLIYSYYSTYKSISLDLKTNTIEYGENTDPLTLINSDIKDIDIQTDLNTNEVGDYDIKYILTKKDNLYGFKVKKSFDYLIHVKDSKAPIIKTYEDNVSIYVNSEYDLKSNIETVYDEIDGEILDYEINTNLDIEKTGDYEVKIIAKDKNGLSSIKTYTITVKNRPVISVNDGYYYIDNYLNNVFGFNRAARCAILANIKFESTFNPTVGDYYYGLIQWGGSRRDNLYAYCANNGYDYSSYDGQLQFMYYELTNLYPSVYNYLNNASDSASGAFDAAVYFCNVYEGAATSAGRGELAYTYYESGQ